MYIDFELRVAMMASLSKEKSVSPLEVNRAALGTLLKHIKLS